MIHISTIGCCPILLKEEPDFRMLNNLVGAEIPAKWKSFGLQVGLQPGVLDGIESNRGRDYQDSFYQVFTEWRNRKSSDFTWVTVIIALCSNMVNERHLANKIFRSLNKHTNSVV